MSALENRIPPPFVFVLVAVAMWGGAHFYPATVLNDWSRAPLAGIFALCGFVIPLLAVRTFRRAGTTLDPINIETASSLVTSGIFRYSRNPMYVGLTTMLLGWAIWLGSPVTVLGPIAFALFINRFQIIPEERVLGAKFGAAYDAYCQSVRRWL